MLKELKIRNLAIIDDLAVKFDKGLNVLTGETGAGKSIIVDALGFALGDRAQAELIRAGEKEAVVEAFFEPEGQEFPDIGIDISDGVILRRVLSSTGKSRAYINDSGVTLQTLSEVGSILVDIHSQHEHQSLLSQEKQRLLLDSHGRLFGEREKVAALFQEVQALKKELQELKQQTQQRAHRIDLLRFQIGEIKEAALEKQEKELLERERNILVNQARLNSLAESAASLLYAMEGSCTESLSQALKQVREMNHIDPGMDETVRLLESARPLIEEAAGSLRSYKERYDTDPGRLDSVEERLEIIKRLERKYGAGIEGIIRYWEEAESELAGLETSDERLAGLEGECAEMEGALRKAALDLSEKRMQTARRIEEYMEKTLKELGFGRPVFRISVTKDEDGGSIAAHGIDRVEFLFSANPGEPPKALAKIVSGGELSRVMLGLKSILADVDKVPVLIFDEVDAGIGGETAERVGKKLEAIAKTHQLLCITHLPQIAVLGAHHLKISKKAKQNRVYVSVSSLSGQERQAEIARMLSGTITDISRRHAEELLEKAK